VGGWGGGLTVDSGGPVMNHKDDREAAAGTYRLDSGDGRTAGPRMVSIRMDKIGSWHRPVCPHRGVELAHTLYRQAGSSPDGFSNTKIGQTGTP